MLEFKKVCGVLVVDDEPLVLKYTTSVMTTLGYKNVLRAADAQAARAVLLAETISLIISDVSLPDGDGCELLCEALMANPRAVGLLVTGFGTDELRLPEAIAGRVRFLQKPFTVDEISHLLAELTERHSTVAALA
jgi:DNA-binding NtrC family response regulator